MNDLLGALLASSLRACLAAAGVGLALAVFRVRPAALRHAAWSAVVCAMLLMTPLRRVLPAIPLPVASVEPVSAYEIVSQPAPQPPAPLTRHIAAPRIAPPSVKTPPHTPVEVPIEAPKSPDFWPNLALAVYLIGLLASLARMFAGWLVARRFARSCEPAAPSFDQSRRTVTPLTAGILRPRVVLPMNWREWPDAKRNAVLAHETAHVRRRDNLVNALALLNRALFWFHPLAWWLERELSALAEHACDDAAAEAAGGNRNYAALLLDLAGAARRNGGRLMWQSGMAGAGRFDQRIARLIDDPPAPRVSPSTRAAAALSCAAAIVFAAACQRQVATAPLRDNPERVAMNARNAQQLAAVVARLMTAEQAAALEAALVKDPENIAVRTKLLNFYRYRGVATLGPAKAIEARRRLILWLIEQHPESDLLARELIYPTARDPLPDPAGYAQARKLWLKQIARFDAPVAVLGRAATFFTQEDKPLAEKLLLRAQQLDPKGPWTQELGWLYAQAVVGSNASTPTGIVRSASLADAHGAFAAEVRTKLAQSNDVALLTAAGERLVLSDRGLFQRHSIDFDPLPLGIQCLERALTLDPQAVRAHQVMVIAHNLQKAPGWRTLPETRQYAAISQLPDAKRFLALSELAEGEYFRADNAQYRGHNPSAAKPYWERSKRYAQESLSLAEKCKTDPEYGTALFTAHTVLGMAAMHDADRKAATQHLLAAGEAPSTETLAYSHQMGTHKLPTWLLKDGEREPVIRFLERFAQTDILERQSLLGAAAQIRAGQKPFWYPY